MFVFRTVRSLFRNGWCGVFMQAVKARYCAARRKRVFRDRGNPLDTLHGFIELYSQYRLMRKVFEVAQELKLARAKYGNIGSKSNSLTLLALRYYATGTLLNLDRSIFVAIE